MSKFKIPEDFIEEADIYKIMPIDTLKALHCGGKIMMNQVVREQMDITNILATTGVTQKDSGKKLCIIIVAYTMQEVLQMMKKVVQETGKLIEEGGELNGKN